MDSIVGIYTNLLWLILYIVNIAKLLRSEPIANYELWRFCWPQKNMSILHHGWYFGSV